MYLLADVFDINTLLDKANEYEEHPMSLKLELNKHFEEWLKSLGLEIIDYYDTDYMTSNLNVEEISIKQEEDDLSYSIEKPNTHLMYDVYGIGSLLQLLYEAEDRWEIIIDSTVEVQNEPIFYGFMYAYMLLDRLEEHVNYCFKNQWMFFKEGMRDCRLFDDRAEWELNRG